MSLEAALAETTAALKEVAELLKVSNADRAKLLASAGASAVASNGAGSAAGAADAGLTVREIKEKVKSADLETLEAMLAEENNGTARSSAIKAIEEAIAAKNSEGNSEPAAGAAESASTTATQAAGSPSSAPAAADKNAQPVPAEVSPDQARAVFGAWFGETDDEAERGTRREFVAEIVSKLGANIGELDLEGRRKSVFFLRRKRAGLTVDFGAAYDFAGSPTQEVKAAVPASSGADDLL